MAKVCPHGKVRTVGRGQRRTLQAEIMRMAGNLVTQHLIRRVIGIVFGLGAASPALTRPHVFVDTGLEVIFDDQAAATGLQISRVYDGRWALVRPLSPSLRGDGGVDTGRGHLPAVPAPALWPACP